MAACLNATNRSDLLAVRVPSASNPIASQMALAALKMGSGSNTVDELVRILSLPSGPPVAVFGDDDEIVAATIKVALGKLSANARRPSQQMCVSRQVQAAGDIQQTAEVANIHLLVVP
jgi:hypothetical protein